MPEIVSLENGGRFFHDARRVLPGDADAEGEAVQEAIIPFSRWQERVSAGTVPRAVWLAPDEDFMQLRPVVGDLQLIALSFPTAADGRAYSFASVLRTHYGYRGELRAIGEVQIDQLFFLRRVGFNSAQLRPELSTAATLPTIRAALSTFSERYQGSVDQPLPLFKRRLLGEVLA